MKNRIKNGMALAFCAVIGLASVFMPAQAANKRTITRKRAMALKASRASGRSRAVARRTSRKVVRKPIRRTPVRRAPARKAASRRQQPKRGHRVAPRVTPVFRGSPTPLLTPVQGGAGRALTPVPTPAQDAVGDEANRRPDDQAVVIYETVPGQSGADCGYHALYNGWRKYEQVSNRPTQAFPLEQWKNLVRGMQQGAQKPMIDYEEMLPLANHSGIDPATYSIINDIGQFQFIPAQLKTYPHLINLSEIITRLRTTEGAFHAFIIGNMEHTQASGGALTGTLGHWIAVVAQRLNNRIQYYVMDSMNGRPEGMVNALRKLIENSDLNSLPRISATATLINVLEGGIGQAGAALKPQGLFRRRDPNRALQTLEELSAQLQTARGTYIVSEIEPHINGMMNILDEIEQQTGNQYEARVDALRAALLG